jgi:AcrR family transcriptional regulator
MPRQPLSRDRVLRAATGIVDREGLAALSMRRVGQELDVEAMSLYRWVPNKAALLDGIHEAILAELPPPLPTKSWPRAVRAYATSFRAILVAHPHALPLFATRPAVTRTSLLHVERGLATLRGAGFSIRDAINAFQTVVTFVVGHTLSTHGAIPDDERSTPAYGALDLTTFPTVTEAAKELATHDLELEFAFGLDTIVRGLEARLDRR